MGQLQQPVHHCCPLPAILFLLKAAAHPNHSGLTALQWVGLLYFCLVLVLFWLRAAGHCPQGRCHQPQQLLEQALACPETD